MKKYNVTWEMVVYKQAEVEAESEAEAILMAEQGEGFVNEYDAYEQNYTADEIGEVEEEEAEASETAAV